MMVVQVVATLEGFMALREEWTALLHKSRAANLFLTWEWMFTWWQIFGGRFELMLLTVRRGEALVGIAPLLRERRWAFGVPVRVVKFLGGGVASSDHLDFVLDPESEAVAVAALLDYLKRNRDTWNLLELEEVPAQSPTVATLLAEAPARGYSIEVSERRICPYLPLPSTWEEFVGALSRSLRGNLRYYGRKLAERGVVEFQLWKDPDGLADTMDRFKALHLKRREIKGDEGSFAYLGFEAFHREFAGLALQQGWLRLAFLRVNGEAVAVAYGFQYRGVTYWYQGGFDPAWAEYSVGTLLLGEYIRAAVEEGSREFDFLRGEGAHKSFWTDQVRRNLRVRVGKDTFAHRRFLTAENLRWQVKEMVKRWIPASWWAELKRRSRWFARF